MMSVAFYKHNLPGIPGLFARLIRLVTWGPYSHCELVFTESISYSSSIEDGGTRFKDIQFQADHWDFVGVPAECRENVARAFCIAEKGSAYDFPGVFRFLVPIIGQSPERWFCSEVVCAALQAGGLFPGVKPWKVSPNRLYKMMAKR